MEAVKIKFTNETNGITIEVDDRYIQRVVTETIRNFLIELFKDKKILSDFVFEIITKNDVIPEGFFEDVKNLAAERISETMSRKKVVTETIIKLIEEKERKEE